MKQNGFSLVELMVVIAIVAVLMGLGLGSMRAMLDSNRTRSAAESILSGMRMARSEAIQRNTPMRFQLISTLGSDCVLSTTSQLWVVTQTDQGLGVYHFGDPAGKCDTSPASPADACMNTSATTGACNGKAFIAYKSPGQKAGENDGLSILADQKIVTFGPLGQVIGNADGSGSMTSINVSMPADADAKSWRITRMVTNTIPPPATVPSNSFKLCDPVAGSAMACP